MSTCLLAFVACPPGVEATLADELERLGLIGKVTSGGVLVRCERKAVRRLLQRSRVAHSVRVRLKPFRAENFAQLEAGLARLPWHAYFSAGTRPEFRVTCHRSRLYHSGAVQERAARVVESVWRRGRTEGENPRLQRVYIRVERDSVQVSIDASGPLYRRGYRTHVAEASLRETLAAVAARLLLQHAPQVSRVWDPFCGSGVLPFEWELTRRAAPAHPGPFPMDAWPIAAGLTPPIPDEETKGAGASGARKPEGGAREVSLEAGALRGASVRSATALEPALWLSDVNSRALAAARHNANNAGLTEHCRFLALDFDRAATQVPRGTAILCNPPYGVRLGSEAAARRTLRRFEQRLRERADLRPALVLCPWQALGHRRALPWKQLAQFPNGGLQIAAHWLPPC